MEVGTEYLLEHIYSCIHTGTKVSQVAYTYSMAKVYTKSTLLEPWMSAFAHAHREDLACVAEGLKERSME